MRNTGLVAISLLFALSACQHSVQTTSGRDYLQRHAASAHVKTAKNEKGDSASFQKRLYDAANVEPTLTFPARIGIARLDSNGYTSTAISAIPADEMAAWAVLKEKLGAPYGEFVPVSPLVIQSVKSDNDTPLEQLRLASARQHLDALIVYEVSAKGSNNANILKVADLTILGSFIFPSEQLKSDALAGATLIDVMSGYPYAQASASFSLSELSTSAGRRSGEESIRTQSKSGAVEKLAAEMEKTFEALYASRGKKM